MGSKHREKKPSRSSSEERKIKREVRAVKKAHRREKKFKKRSAESQIKSVLWRLKCLGEDGVRRIMQEGQNYLRYKEQKRKMQAAGIKFTSGQKIMWESRRFGTICTGTVISVSLENGTIDIQMGKDESPTKKPKKIRLPLAMVKDAS